MLNFTAYEKYISPLRYNIMTPRDSPNFQVTGDSVHSECLEDLEEHQFDNAIDSVLKRRKLEVTISNCSYTAGLDSKSRCVASIEMNGRRCTRGA